MKFYFSRFALYLSRIYNLILKMLKIMFIFQYFKNLLEINIEIKKAHKSIRASFLS